MLLENGSLNVGMRIRVNSEHTQVSQLISPWQTTFDQAGRARVVNSMGAAGPNCAPMLAHRRLVALRGLNHIEVKPNPATVEWWLGV